MGIRRRGLLLTAGLGAAAVGVRAAFVGAQESKRPRAEKTPAKRAGPAAKPALESVGAATTTGSSGEGGLVRKLGDAEVDWARGFVIARVGAAADIRLPGPKAARPEAERRARARAAQVLRAAAAELPFADGKKPSAAELDRALASPKVLRIEYQSNGGVLLDLALDFATLVGAPSVECDHESKDAPGHERHHPDLAPVVLEAATARLAVKPTLLWRGRDVQPAFAVYRSGPAPSGDRAVSVKTDKEGRLVLPADFAAKPDALAGRRLLVYVKTLR